MKHYEDLTTFELYELVDHYLDQGGELDRAGWLTYEGVAHMPRKDESRHEEIRALAERLFIGGKFIVAREYSRTDKQYLYKVLSRNMATQRDAESWMRFVHIEEPTKGRDFVVFKIVATIEG